MSWVSRRYRARRKPGRERSGGEGPLAANGKSIWMRYLPAAEVLRCAGFLLAPGSGNAARPAAARGAPEGDGYGTLRNRTHGGEDLRRAGALRRARARILYRACRGAEPGVAFPSVPRPFSAAGGQTQPGRLGGRREDAVKCRRARAGTLRAQ